MIRRRRWTGWRRWQTKRVRISGSGTCPSTLWLGSHSWFRKNLGYACTYWKSPVRWFASLSMCSSQYRASIGVLQRKVCRFQGYNVYISIGERCRILLRPADHTVVQCASNIQIILILTEKEWRRYVGVSFFCFYCQRYLVQCLKKSKKKRIRIKDVGNGSKRVAAHVAFEN